MVSTTITFEKDAVQPPVFVAGGFTDWEPVEMTHKATESNGSVKIVFSHQIEIEPGKYQYKFRLGPGDWWVLDESTPTAPDENGNLNNILSVEPQQSKAATEPPAETIPTPAPQDLITQEAPVAEDEPKLNGAAEHEEVAIPQPLTEESGPSIDDSGSAEASQTAIEPPRHDSEKQVQFDEQTGTITAEIVQPRNDSIPDVAPPPYSALVDVAVNDTQTETPVAPVKGAPAQKQSNEPAVTKAQPETKQQSFIARICSGRSLLLVFAIAGIPIAVSYYLHR